MRTTLLLILSFVLFGNSVWAQGESERRNAVPVHAFKFSPLHLINFYPTIQCAYEFRVSGKWTLQLDGGLAVHTHFSEQQNRDITSKKGYKLKLEPRYYFDWGRQRRTAFYGATELYFNNISFDHEYEQTECFDETCSDKYTRRYYYRANYQEAGVAFKMGMLLYLFKDFMIDYNVGIGVRSINYTFPSYIDYKREKGDVFPVPRMDDRVVPTPILNLRVGYRIR